MSHSNNDDFGCADLSENGSEEIELSDSFLRSAMGSNLVKIRVNPSLPPILGMADCPFSPKNKYTEKYPDGFQLRYTCYTNRYFYIFDNEYTSKNCEKPL